MRYEYPEYHVDGALGVVCKLPKGHPQGHHHTHHHLEVLEGIKQSQQDHQSIPTLHP